MKKIMLFFLMVLLGVFSGCSKDGHGTNKGQQDSIRGSDGIDCLTKKLPLAKKYLNDLEGFSLSVAIAVSECNADRETLLKYLKFGIKDNE